MRRIWKLFSLVTLLLPSVFLCGQTGSGGTIQGTITDPSNAAIAGAAISVTNMETGVVTQVKSTSAGYYAAPSLIPGTYSVQVEKRGFKNYVQQNITVNALQTVGLNIPMSVGSATESVTVTAAPPSLETENATITVNMENDTYIALPLNMGGSQRDPTDFASLTPGYSGGGRSGTYNGAGGDTNGDSDSGAVTYLDGVPISQGDNRQISLAVSVDAVDQFQVTSSGTNASQTGMGSQNYNVKHGTNKFHGSAYDFVRNTEFDSWNFFAKASTVKTNTGATVQEPKPAEHQAELGFTFGGPIKKDKIFNFVSGELYRYTAYVNPSLMTVPTQAERNGDFSALDYPIYDPTTLQVSGSKYTSQQFSYNGKSNVIPPGRISQISQNMLQFLPLPTNDGLTSNYLSTHQTGNDNYEITERFDYVVTPRQRISILGNSGKRGFIGYDYSSNSDLPLPYVDGVLVTQFMDSGIFEHTFIATSNLVNQLKIGYVRMNAPVKNPSEQNSALYAATKMGIGNIPAGGASNDFPAVTLSGGEYGYSAWYSPTGYTSANNEIVLHDDLSWNHAKHLVTGGFDLQSVEKNASSWLGTSGPLSITYASGPTQGFSSSSGTNLTSKSGDSLATYLLGGVTSASVTIANYSTLGTRVKPFSPYVQDDWKILPNLTLNLGLRWDLFPVVVEVQDRGSFMNPTITNPDTNTPGAMSYYGYGNGRVNRRSAGNTYYGNFGPRLGAAYSPLPNTVIRTAFGMNYSRSGTANITTGQSGWNTKTSFPTTVNGEQPAFYLNNTNSNYPAWSNVISLTSDVNTGDYYNTATQSYPNPNSVNMAYPGVAVRAPTVYNWNFGIEQSFLRSMTLAVNYVGSSSHFLSSSKSYMGTDAKYNVIGMYLSDLPASMDSATGRTFLADAQSRASGILLPYASYGGSNATISHMLTPFPQYSSVSQQWGPHGNADYHGLQAIFTQKPSHGVSYAANFTWSKTLGNTDSYRANGDLIPANVMYGAQSWRTDAIEHTYSLYDQPYNFHIYGSYKIPLGKNHFGGTNLITRQLGSGWQVSGIYQIASGRPLSFSPGSMGYNPGFSGPIRINGKYGHGYLAGMSNAPRYIDINGFIQTPRYVIGNIKDTAPYNLRYPHSSDIDMAVMRTFDIYKELKFTFRAEVFNLTNHVEFKGITVSWPGSCAYPSTAVDFGQGGGTCAPTSSDAWGRVSSQGNSARDWQFSGKLNF